MARDDELMGQGSPVSSCSPALDYILRGGYASNRVHLIPVRRGGAAPLF